MRVWLRNTSCFMLYMHAQLAPQSIRPVETLKEEVPCPPCQLVSVLQTLLSKNDLETKLRLSPRRGSPAEISFLGQCMADIHLSETNN